ncbi:hypothetical protein AB0P37_33365 [Streptomyces antimycoticus]|uniref:hypothetical protein n=1 Tax=Streptomyces antimycoticus TaxID=68175 RepID=UPI00341B5AC8
MAVGEFGGDEVAAAAGCLGVGDGLGGGADPLGELGGARTWVVRLRASSLTPVVSRFQVP